MKRIAELVTAIACSAFLFGVGCEAVPDEDTLDQLRTQVASFPAELNDVMARWAANRIAFGYCLNYQYNDLGQITCTSNGVKDVTPLTVMAMLHCLDKHPTTLYKDCLDILLEDVADEHPGADCEWTAIRPELRVKNMPEKTNADRITTDDITEGLLGPPPPVEIQLILMGIPGFVGPKGALCVQVKQDWACAPDPFDGDQNPTTSAASGGGDR